MKADKSVVFLADYMSLIEKAAADGNRFVLLEYCDCMDGNKDKAIYVATCLILTVATIVLIGLSASSIAMHAAAPDAALVNDLLKAVR